MWFPYALFDAIAATFAIVISKHQVKTQHPTVTLFFNICSIVFFMFVILMLQGGFPHATEKFYLYVFIAGLLDAIAFSCGYWAMRHSPISLLAPLSALIPIFVTIFGALFLHEIPNTLKLLGILTIVLGIYLLNASDIKGGLFKPFQKLFSDKCVKLYFVQVFIWGITPVFQKQAIYQMHPIKPLFAGFVDLFFCALFLSFFALPQLRKGTDVLKKGKLLHVGYGIFYAVALYAAYIALSLTNIGYASAVFNLSALFTVVLGGILLKENHAGERLLGASVMILGAILLAL